MGPRQEAYNWAFSRRYGVEYVCIVHVRSGGFLKEKGNIVGIIFFLISNAFGHNTGPCTYSQSSVQICTCMYISMYKYLCYV